MIKKAGEVKDFFEEKAEALVEKMERTSPRKLVVVILSMLTAGVLILGLLQIKLQLDQPFFADRMIEDKGKIRGPREFLEFFRQQQSNNDSIVRMQQKDSDQDTLTDYQEKYIYKTNPYSADSDVDGVEDNLELDQNTDPNCPRDSVCDAEGFVVSPENEKNADGGIEANLAETMGPAIPSAIVPTVDVETLLNEDVLKNIISQSQKGTAELKQLTEEEKAQIKEYFLGLSSAELRQALVEKGYPAQDPGGLPDEVLMTILEEILNSL